MTLDPQQRTDDVDDLCRLLDRDDDIECRLSVLESQVALILADRIKAAKRVRDGLAKARERGNVGGRPRISSAVIKRIRELRADGLSIADVAALTGVSGPTVLSYTKQ